ncbi:MAG: hypothetical protein Q9174_003903 [Haloplaca sp. 1 TL-2023]
MVRTRNMLQQPEDIAVAANTPVPATPPVTRRKALGEISGNQEGRPAAINGPEQSLKANKSRGKGKKGKGQKKAKKEIHASENCASKEEVLPDENESETSSAVEDACQDLLQEKPSGSSQMIIHDRDPQSSTSPAVTATTEQLSPQDTSSPSATAIPNQEIDPRQDREVTKTEVENTQMDFSMVNNQQSSNEALIEDLKPEQEESPAALEESKTSPRTIMARPEDPIEAMDQLEDEMDQIGNLIPTTKTKSPAAKERKARPSKQSAPSVSGKKEGAATRAALRGSTRATASTQISPASKPKLATSTTRGKTVHPLALAKKQAVADEQKDRQISNSSSGSESKGSAAATKKRVSSVHKTPFVPAKSTKPPTRASFELPGDAVARKLREAREERLKRDEEEKDKPAKTAFKARPVRVSQAPIVKATAASRARISMAKGEVPGSVTKDGTPKPQSSSHLSKAPPASAGKRLSTLSVPKRAAPAAANTSARVNRGTLSAKTTTRRPSTQASVRQSVTPADAMQQKATGKEVYNRGKIEQEERDKMRKDKEEAAKKARAEAAERGRLASREWAEKQKQKKLAEKKGSATATVADVSA